MNNSLSNLLLAIVEIWLAVSCVLMVLFIAAAFLAFRWVQRFLAAPNLADMDKKLQALRAANPRATTDQLVRRIIRQQSFKAGIIGAITGLGGFVTLPVALPVDLVASLRVQATMVQFIALLYGQGKLNPEDSRIQTYLIMSGGVEVTEASVSFIMRLVLRFLGESLSTLVPFIGAVVGFGVNYAISQATGNVAMRWYSHGQHV